MPEIALKEIQARGFCNWCRRTLQADELSDSNFIDTGKIFPSSQKKAYAVYCNNCMQDDFRKKQPKTALNKDTLDEVDISLLPESKQEAKAEQKAREDTLKATGASKTVKITEKLSDRK